MIVNMKCELKFFFVENLCNFTSYYCGKKLKREFFIQICKEWQIGERRMRYEKFKKFQEFYTKICCKTCKKLQEDNFKNLLTKRNLKLPN